MSTLARLLLAGLCLFACLAPSLGASASDGLTILYNGTVIPMTAPDIRFSAIAIRGGLIEALGTDEDILAIAGEDRLAIDLAGRAVYPGFIDAHAHLLGHANLAGLSMAGAEQLALSYGVTHVTDMHVSETDLRALTSHARTSGALRVSAYLIYNDGCGYIHGPWYTRYRSDQELAPRLYVGGVKIFSETSVCGSSGPGISFSDAEKQDLSVRGRTRYGRTEPLFDKNTLAGIIQAAEDAGFQVAVHAIGDGGIHATLDAIEIALDGGLNAYRHMLLHNWFVFDDALDRYVELGVPLSIEAPSPCYVASSEALLAADSTHVLFRAGDLVRSGAIVASSSDWPWVVPANLNPMYRLSMLVNGFSATADYWASNGTCPSLDASSRVTAWQALRMMTANAAYVLRIEHLSGTLEPGKRADLVVLSNDPLQMSPAFYDLIQAEITMVGGEIVWEQP